MTAEYKQKDDTIEGLNNRVKCLEQELEEKRELINKQEIYINDVNKELIKVIHILLHLSRAHEP